MKYDLFLEKNVSCIDARAVKGKSLRLKQSFSRLFFLFFVFCLLPTLKANTPTGAESPLNIGLHLKNMHLWQGSVVTAGPMMATSLEYVSKDDKFIAGLWGGASFNGDYKEFSYYLNYYFTERFYLQLISHNNYSNSATPDIFSYDKYLSPNFLDLVIATTVSESFPLKVFTSTILFGQGGDYAQNEDGSVSNSYSHYVELSYPLVKNAGTELRPFIGGAFSLMTDKTFYSSQAALVNVGLTFNQELSLFSTLLPVSLTAFWNPYSGVGALQIDIQLF